jgi:fermentation-respiration switch protein FrsA (DUF1100 family)
MTRQKYVFSAFPFLMQRVVSFLIVLAVFLLLLGLGCADRLARVALFHPSKYTQNLSTATSWEVQFQNSKKQTLHGCYFPYQKIDSHGSPAGTILYSHGNGENVSHLLDFADQMRSDFRCNVLIFDYAGYGKSEGKPTAPGILDDGLAALTYLNQQEGIPVNQIIVYGFSLGGSVVVDLASKYEVKALIVESSFTSLGEMGRKMFPILPAEYFLWEQLSSIKKISHVRCPVFISHGRADQVIPFSQGQRLFEAANEPKTFFIPPEGFDDHSAPHSQEHNEALRQFIGSL